MKKFFVLFAALLLLVTAANFTYTYISAEQDTDKTTIEKTEAEQYKYPEFYRGIYLNVASARNMDKLKSFVELANDAGINTFVLDVQGSSYKKSIVPNDNVQYCIDNGIHPIARIVIFPDGLKHWPVTETYLKEKLDIAESACKNGFKEIQFDYIRFDDSSRNRHLSNAQRYKFIEDFIVRARKQLEPYNVKIAADVFGRIPLNKNDIIGQQMESMDKVVDFICPMAYPSHYTWSKKLQTDPYYTVYITSKRAKERAKKAEIVTWIQAFQMKLYGMPYDKYINKQIKAVHEAGIRGYFLWNARQDYDVPFKVVKEYYKSADKNIAKDR
jgi:hypothetical protein